jgi:hypothetical protein
VPGGAAAQLPHHSGQLCDQGGMQCGWDVVGDGGGVRWPGLECGDHSQPGLLSQLDLNQLDLNQLPRLADPLPAGRHGRGQGAIGQVPGRLATTTPQLALAHPAALAGQRLAGQADDCGGMVVGEPVEGGRPEVQLQPGQPQAGPGRQHPGVAEHAPPNGPARLLPPLHTLADSALP